MGWIERLRSDALQWNRPNGANDIGDTKWLNQATGQWIGRTSQNKTLNFHHAANPGESLAGRYLPVLVTRAGPNSLAGESVVAAAA